MTVVRDIPGGPWYVEGAHYPSALQAKRAWERTERKLIRAPGEEGVGVTRLAPNAHPDAISSGAPKGAHMVVVVTRDETMLRKAQHLLRDGTAWDPNPGFCDALISRRARMVLAQESTGSGKVTIRRPESRGAFVYEGGEVRERPPGQG